ncbi:hypothetical protein Tco_0770484 [Tanacetum coccineum]|uniref:Uncharacterized protein n=1 Tax=Tanacetum coccineum TaxID=301880 RepID=A0ABQ4ZG86_9ASTR
MKDDVDITFMGSSSFDQKMEEVDSDLESMHDDEIMSMSGNEDEEADSDSPREAKPGPFRSPYASLKAKGYKYPFTTLGEG